MCVCVWFEDDRMFSVANEMKSQIIWGVRMHTYEESRESMELSNWLTNKKYIALIYPNAFL